MFILTQKWHKFNTFVFFFLEVEVTFVKMSSEIDVGKAKCSLAVLIKAEDSHEQFLTLKSFLHHTGLLCKKQRNVCSHFVMMQVYASFSPQQTAHALEVFSTVVNLKETSRSQVPVVPGCLRNTPRPQGA